MISLTSKKRTGGNPLLYPGFTNLYSACQYCPIRPVCGGCLAVTYGSGREVSQERDPLCFMDAS
jgi:radical SAM protein with 4Fe4S-binding SPASM domain